MRERRGVIYSANIECLLYSGIILEAEGIVKNKIDVISSFMELNSLHLFYACLGQTGVVWGSRRGGMRR